MKKIYQDVSTGETLIEDIPRPVCPKGHVLIKSTISLISAGTERMLVDFGKANYLNKARQQPDKVAEVLNKIKTDGLLTTIDAVKSKLDQPLAMGYSNVGVVVEVGAEVTDFKIGDRVVSNGSHAELVCVPRNLVARIPDNVSDKDAVYTVVGAIALQGVRLIQPSLGECIVVTGLGLIGLLTVQILKANGCRVLGLDYDASRVKIARSFGAEGVVLDATTDPVSEGRIFSRGRGVDAVIITATTNSNAPIHDAANMCRKRGRIVLVGTTGLNIMRSDFYEKELSFQVSCSYGPGRYDSSYEEDGNDYPLGFVRWTENRNFEAILDMFAEEKVNVSDLTSHEFALDQAKKAYEVLLHSSSVLGIVLSYDYKNSCDATHVDLIPNVSKKRMGHKVVVGAIGAGNHAGRTLLPAVKTSGARLKTISSSQGMTSNHYGKKLSFEINSTDTDEIFNDCEVNAVFIATRHDSHAELVISSLENNKNIFVEKPLAISLDDLKLIEKKYENLKSKGINPIVMVGFNRRFSPLMKSLKNRISNSSPIAINYTCNAGFIPTDHWVHDTKKGGGRIIGEACHFIDICRYLADSPVVSINTHAVRDDASKQVIPDTVTISMSFANGSIASINYFANGSKSFPKERIEVFQNGGVAVIDNFKSLKSYNFNGLKNRRFMRQNKGILECVEAFVSSIEKGQDNPIPFEEIIEVSRLSIEAANSIKIIKQSSLHQ